jgi:homoserine kinase
MRSIRALAPATVANVCCGFDVLGFAVEAPADEVIITLRERPGIIIESIESDGGKLSLDPQKNTAGVAVSSYLKGLKSNQGVSIVLKKKLPLGSGMGSSAASAVAALVAINHLMGEPFSRKEMVVHAMEAERVACGSAHADNAAPSLLGGFVLIRSYAPLDVIPVPCRTDLICTLIHPHIELKTLDSRRVLRETVSLKDSIIQSGNLAALMIGLTQGDYDLISRSLNDVIAEPVRSVFIPGFNELKEKVKQSGALGFGISGSGPTVFALSRTRDIAEAAGTIAGNHFCDKGLPFEIYISGVNMKGATLV